MAGDRHEAAQGHDHVTMDDLTMIDIELELQVRQAEFPDQALGRAEIMEEISRHVSPVDRLDQQVDTLL
ncbi:hypothetical protein D9M70_547720 [compost metagenome]